MANLTRRQWGKGWLPNSDSINGDREGLLRMENLYLDDEGVVSLVRGIQKVHNDNFGAYVHSIYSKIINDKKYRYVGLGNGTVLRGESVGDVFSFGTQILSGGHNTIAAFDEAFGFVLACSGKKLYKDKPGTGTFWLTPEQPGAPSIGDNSQAWIPFFNEEYGNWTARAGTITAQAEDHIIFTAPSDPLLATVYVAKTTPTTTYVGGRGNDPDSDVIKFSVRIGDTAKLESVKIQFLLNPPTVSETGLTISEDEYYTYTWVNTVDGVFAAGIDAWTTLEARRGDFERVGFDPSLNWDAVYGIIVSFVTTGTFDNNVISDFRIYGGPEGVVHGTYQYAQVNVYDTGANQFKSPLGDPTDPLYVLKGTVNITPGPYSDPQVNKIWIFRRDSGVNIDVVPLGTPRKLDQWYRVAELNPGESFEDNVSDEEAIELNIVWNENLIGTYDIPDDIIGIQTGLFGRTLYLTFKELYISDRDDPGLVDSSATIKISGNPAEKNLWVKKVGLGTCYVASTEDIYELSGTFNLQEDGSLDVYKKGLGVPHPPICYQVTADNSNILYMSNDGVRSVGGAEDDIVTKPLDLIIQGHSRYEIGPALISAFAQVAYPVLVGRDRFFISVPMQNGTRWLFVYSLKNKYWFPYYTDPICLYEEEDGTILAGYGGGSGNYLRELDKNDSSGYSTLDAGDGQRIVFQTVYDDDNLPRNRKDTFTFKCLAYTGGSSLTIQVAKNGTDTWTTIGVTAFGAAGTKIPQEKAITIAESIGLGKSFAVRLVCDKIKEFKFYHFTIEYDARPEQLTYLRIPYTNLNTISRKRFINFAFVLDTLGQECTFTPLIDGEIAGDDSTIILSRKGTHIHYFDTEQVGIDIGGIICGFFEYYGPNLEEIISEKLPVPATYLVIPQDDYGTPNRKRHSSYKFVINTRGYNVRFTPRLDGVNQATFNFSTIEKQVVEYYFTTDTIAINIGGTLESTETPKQPFEFYGPIKPQEIEVLPPRLKEFRIPENNYGVAARKRVRTMPMEINTNGHPVIFTPIVDNVAQTPSTITTATRQTAFHFFNYDSFGIDYSGELVGVYPFEFYGLMKPEGVEILPVAKKFDQIGPLRLDKLGKFQALRVRLISTGDNNIPIKILNESEVTIPFMTANSGEYSTTFPVIPNIDDIYEIILPKTVNGTVFRIELGPTVYPFHRYDIQVKVVISGMEANPKWIKIGGNQ